VIRPDSAPPVVVVTGANGGLGQALTKVFVDHGAYVAAIGRQSEPVVPASPNFSYWQSDVADASRVAATFTAIRKRFGCIDVLFSNAAVYPKASFLEQDPADWVATIATNVNGVAFCCRAALQIMLEQSKGRIYCVGSFADLAPIPKSAAYAASKGAVRALVKGIAADLHGVTADVQIHEWIPGHLKTRMSDYTGMDPLVAARWALQMVLADSASENGTIFEENREWKPPERLRTRLMRLVGLKR
jgi:NAD(P)-dependent dehydrogenase (short-subunit alcohol dehydrogenase family)